MNQIRKKLFFIMGVIVLLSMAVIVGYNVHTLRLNERMKRQEYQNNLQVYMQFIEDSMEDGENALFTGTQRDVNLKRIIKSESSVDRNMALMRKKKEFQKEIQKNHFLDGMFLYDSANETYVGEVGSYVDSAMHEALKENTKRLVQEFNEGNLENRWTSEKLGGGYYLVRMMKMKTLYLGVWMKPEHLIEELEAENETDIHYLLSGSEGELLTPLAGLSGWDAGKEQVELNQVRYRVYRYDSEAQDISIAALARENGLQELLLYFIAPAALVLCMGGLCFGASWAVVRKKIFNPIDNIMLRKTLEKNEASLRFLQLQMNPHFLNNCLSLIRNLILFEQYDEAETAVLELSDYTRASFQPDIMIPLSRELAHIQSWYALQKLRMKNRILVRIDVAEEMAEEMVPTMLLATFVENAAKHFGKPDETLEISVKADYGAAEGGERTMEFIITDNGVGFAPEALARLQKNESFTDEKGMKHVGISSIRERLQILYEGRARLELANAPSGGAQIRISIPKGGDGR